MHILCPHCHNPIEVVKLSANEEIAPHRGCVVRTVERQLPILCGLWEQETET